MPIKLADTTELSFGACKDGQTLKRVGMEFVGYTPSAGSGDMTKAVYDTNDDGKVNAAVAADTLGGTTPTAAGLALLDDADNTAQRTTLGLGTAATHAHGDYDAAGAAAAAQAASQPLDSDLTAIAALVSGADKVPYATGIGAWALAVLTLAGRNLIAAVDAAAARVVLGLGSIATFNDAPSDGTTYGRLNGAWAAAGGDPWLFKGALANDVSTGANVTPVDVTGLVFSFVANGKYLIEVFGAGRSAAATTGWGMQLNTSVAVTSVWMRFDHQLANTGTMSGGSSIADDASVGVSSGVPTLNVDCPFYASGVLVAGANAGTAQLRWRSEVAAVSTVRAGTIMRVQRIS